MHDLNETKRQCIVYQSCSIEVIYVSDSVNGLKMSLSKVRDNVCHCH
ncbi:MAG: hypothetical protein R2750_00855 [Bacteroidales bacterium]